MSLRNNFIEFKREVCPICGRRGRCKNSAEHPGDLILCFRINDELIDGFRRVKSASECTTYVRIGSSADRNDKPGGFSMERASPNLNEKAVRYTASITEDQVQRLANDLGVSAESLRAINIGSVQENPCFPEHDARGNVVGISVRHPDGNKRVGKGHHRGLTIPNELDSLPDPVLIVEGPTDVAACLTMGLTAVGRPNNTGTGKELAELLSEREVIVVGENDQKPDESWPGREGATKIAAELSNAWDKPVSWALPPANVKDVRDFLLANHERNPLEIGCELLAALKANTQTAEAKPVLDTLISPPHKPPWPEAPDDTAYHGLAGEFVKRIEPETEADPVALLVNFLVAFGNTVGRQVCFMADGARHHLNIFAVLIGETSKGRKGTAWARVIQRFLAVAAEWAEKRVTGGLSSGEGLIWQVRDPIIAKKQEKEKGKAAQMVELVVDAGVDDKRLMLIEAEFANVLKVTQREGNTLSPIIRKAWESGTLKALTKNSPAHATGAHVSIIGHCTAEELRRYLDRTEIANGFGNRFLWVAVRRSKVLPEGGHLDENEFADLTPRITEAIAFASQGRLLVRDEGAKRLWAEIYPELSDGKPGLSGVLTGRAEAQVMRLAAIYAVLDLSPATRVEHLTAALALWEYTERSVQWCFGDAVGDAIADTILLSVRKTGRAGLTRTELSNLFGRNIQSDRITRALELLLDRGQIVSAKTKTDGRSAEYWYASEHKPTKETK